MREVTIVIDGEAFDSALEEAIGGPIASDVLMDPVECHFTGHWPYDLAVTVELDDDDA